MSRLARYLTKLFFVQAFGLLAILAGLVWLTNTLRLFDLITAKGQGMITLFGQAGLTTPRFIISFLGVAMAIAVVRVLGHLQGTGELHAIHTNQRLGAIWSAVSGFAIPGLVLIIFLTHFVDPAASRSLRVWSAQIAADIFSRALTPHRFTEITPGVVVMIEGRASDGAMTGFFAHDTRDQSSRRTFIAERAYLVFDESGQQLRLADGKVFYESEEDGYSEIGFGTYLVGLDRLSSDHAMPNKLAETMTPRLLQLAWAQGGFPLAEQATLNGRLAEITRLLTLLALAVALSAFPHARRGRWRLPLELVIVMAAFGERVVSNGLRGPAGIGYYTGSLVFLAMAAAILFWRLRRRDQKAGVHPV